MGPPPSDNEKNFYLIKLCSLDSESPHHIRAHTSAFSHTAPAEQNYRSLFRLPCRVVSEYDSPQFNLNPSPSHSFIHSFIPVGRVSRPIESLLFTIWSRRCSVTDGPVSHSITVRVGSTGTEYVRAFVPEIRSSVAGPAGPGTWSRKCRVD